MMSEAVGKVLYALLARTAHAGSFATRRDAHLHSRQQARGHAEDVRVKVVRVQQINFFSSQVSNETSQLSERVHIVETPQFVTRHLAQTQLIDFTSQDAIGFQTGKPDLKGAASVKQPRQLHGLPLGAALVETINQLEDASFHD
jgi:hypothetical protein